MLLMVPWIVIGLFALVSTAGLIVALVTRREARERSAADTAWKDSLTAQLNALTKGLAPKPPELPPILTGRPASESVEPQYPTPTGETYQPRATMVPRRR